MNDAMLRMVKIAAIVMAVMIVLGTTTLLVMLARRGAGAEVTVDRIAAILDEPPGTRIAAIAAVRERLAVQLTGGGTDRVVFIDPLTGQVTGRVALAR